MSLDSPRSVFRGVPPVALGVAAAIFFCAAWMAYVSLPNAHPDETNHVDAASYYSSHWLPPLVGDPATRKSRSVFGVSYLDEFELTYFFSGLAMRLAKPFALSEVGAMRIYHLLMLLVLLGVVAAHHFPPALLLFLVTPQVWYVFSYGNGDAFPLFTSALAAATVANIQRHVDANRPEIAARWFTALGVPLALLVLSKKNYWVVVMFVLLALAWLCRRERARVPIAMYRRGVVTGILVFLAIAGTVRGIDLARNGLDRSRLAAVVEEAAGPAFKRSTPLHQSYRGLWLREKGVTPLELFTKWHYHKILFGSFAGLYGPMTLQSPKWYYGATLGAYGAIAVIVLGAGSRRDLPLKFLAVAATLALFGAALYRSWTFDFQAQGRYLFPAIPIFSVLVILLRPPWRIAALTGLLWSCLLLGIYSFVSAGILQIAR